MDEIHTLLGRHLPGYEVRSITRLEEGSDNAAYEVEPPKRERVPLTASPRP